METISGNNRNSSHLIIGILLVIGGILLIGEVSNIFPWRLREYLFTWQAFLMILGLIFIAGRDSKPTGFILLAIGAFFMLPKIFRHLDFDWGSIFWPVMLIILGLVIIFRRSAPRHKTFQFDTTVSSEDIIDDISIFGGHDRVVVSQQFRGGRITNVFGGSKYNMNKARLAPGKQVIDVAMVFGGSKFIVPEDWDIRIEVMAIFGGFSDKRMNIRSEKDPERTLIFKGVTIFGGGELVNY